MQFEFSPNNVKCIYQLDSSRKLLLPLCHLVQITDRPLVSPNQMGNWSSSTDEALELRDIPDPHARTGRRKDSSSENIYFLTIEYMHPYY